MPNRRANNLPVQIVVTSSHSDKVGFMSTKAHGIAFAVIDKNHNDEKRSIRGSGSEPGAIQSETGGH
jgi:hypothetical protein